MEIVHSYISVFLVTYAVCFSLGLGLGKNVLDKVIIHYVPVTEKRHILFEFSQSRKCHWYINVGSNYKSVAICWWRLLIPTYIIAVFEQVIQSLLLKLSHMLALVLKLVR